MKPYRTILVILYTVTLTSLWWTALLWPTTWQGAIWVPTIILTVGSILTLIGLTIDEK